MMRPFKDAAGTRFALLIALTAVVCSAFSGCMSKEVNFTPEAGYSGPAITHFSFNKMVIDGKEYDDVDVAIDSDGHSRMWRNHAHLVDAPDIEALVDAKTHTLIIGIGVSSQVTVTDEAVSAIKTRGVELHIVDTMEAVKLFNRLPKNGLVAAFHTAC